MIDDNAAPAVATREWPVLRSLAGWRPSYIGPDFVAGLTLAAIAVPEQMATARLGGLEPQIGFLALIAGAVGFALFGASKLVSVGADSTIAPIFAGALALIASSGGADYAGAAAFLALGVGLVLTLGGALRLGFVADLLSIPVTTGFLAGISVHILVSQAPALLGLDAPPGPTVEKIVEILKDIPAANPWTLGIGLGVLATMLIGEKLSPRFPGALIAMAAATALTASMRLEGKGVSTLGAIAGVAPKFALPHVSLTTMLNVAPLALIVGVVVMVQTAATTRSFVSDPIRGPDVNRDFIGVGAANLLAGLTGAFPVDASPPRTAVVAETGGMTQIGALVCAALALLVSLYGGQALAHVPHAALAGVLLFVAQRIVRVSVMADVWKRSLPEFGLVVATTLAIVALPIQQGVGLGIMLSIVHGVWTTTRARLVEFRRIEGTSIWWPVGEAAQSETVAGVRVVALQAPLSFLNAYEFQQSIQALAKPGVRLIVIEANAIVEIDYTGAKILSDVIGRLRSAGVDVAVARLESVRAQASFAHQGLQALLGRDHIFHSVEEAVDALGPGRAA